MKAIPFSSENLADSLSNSYTSPQLISSKNHFKYLLGYLSSSEINAQQIIIEEDYISKDFLHDYASYYAFCFAKYPKFCRRVHFFNKSFTNEELIAAILGENKDFIDHYLGFIVVKPIPFTVLGYTILKTYLNGNHFDSRNFWGTRKYKVHIFGNEVELDSLAFQEQDSVLAACATTAIWSMLNKASTDFHTTLKSPSQITKDADNLSYDGSRLFPNKGLDLIQICQAILKSGLVSEVKRDDNPVSNRYIKKILNAYSSIGIPLILVISVPIGNTYGLHAITVMGFKQKAPERIPPGIEISWLSDNIEKFYAHDDQWGPFLRIEFNGDNELLTEWTTSRPDKKATLTNNIIVPIYPKIRISYEDIEVMVLGLDTILTILFNKIIISDLIWDIKIVYSESFKSEIQKSNLDSGVKFSILTKSLPKYLWIATCYIEQYRILDFTFDATNVSKGMIGIDIICCLSDDVKAEFKKFLSMNESFLTPLFNHVERSEYYKFLIDNL